MVKSKTFHYYTNENVYLAFGFLGINAIIYMFIQVLLQNLKLLDYEDNSRDDKSLRQINHSTGTVGLNRVATRNIDLAQHVHATSNLDVANYR